MQLQTGYERPTRFGVKELKNSEAGLRAHFSNELEYCSLFLMPVHQSDPDSVKSCEAFIKEVSSSLIFRTGMTDFPEAILSGSQGYAGCLLQYLIFENIEPGIVKRVLLNKLQEISGRNHRSIRDNRLGLFIPRTGRIICFSFAHSGSMYYRYRLAEFRLKAVPGNLSSYLLSLLSYCPKEYFLSGSRASGFIININTPMEHSSCHSLSSYAIEALKAGKFRSGHENVEKYFLESDPETIACEVPVWYEQPQNSKLRINGKLTGHIDILRYEKNGMIGIWDYKPRAKSEKKAHMQVYLYALMLSQRTGIPLSKFLCGYFDCKDAYYFKAGDAGY